MTHTEWKVAVVVAATALAGCTVKTVDSGDGGAAGAGDGTSGTFAGNLGGASFALKSGFAHVDGTGAMDIVLSNQSGACTSAQSSRLHAGETLVQLYSLKGSAPGTFVSTTTDLKYATVKTSCTSGTPVEGEVERAGRATSSKITINAVGDTSVSGSIDIAFDDGSSATGSFVVPTCSATVESSSCW